MIKTIIRKMACHIKFNFNKKFTRPHWVTISNGPIKGAHLFLHPEINSMWKDMSLGTHDHFLYDVLSKNLLTEGMVIWDVGAHVGYHSLGFASIVGKKGTVIAFEPNPFNIERIKMHLQENSIEPSLVSVKQFALSDVIGESEFRFSSDVDRGYSSGGYLHSISPPLDHFSYRSFKKLIVRTSTGDDIVKSGVPVPQIMKIDVEGAEYSVLKGCQTILKEFKPILFIEVHDIINMFYVQQILVRFNYTLQVLDEENATKSRCFLNATIS